MRQSSAKFPGPDVAEAEDEGLLLSETIFDMLEMFQTNALENFFHRHAGELHATKQIGAELLKMSPHYPAQLFFRELVAESDPDIAQRQLAVVRQDKPRDSTADVAEGEQDWQRQQNQRAGSGAVEKISSVIEHQSGGLGYVYSRAASINMRPVSSAVSYAGGALRKQSRF